MIAHPGRASGAPSSQLLARLEELYRNRIDRLCNAELQPFYERWAGARRRA